MNVAVVVPFQSDGGQRDFVWDLLQEEWERTFPEWPVYVGTVTERHPWSKAAAVADALRYVDAEVVVIADADVWCPDVRFAVAAVTEGDYRWAVPHRLVQRLDRDTTDGLLLGAVRPPWHGGDYRLDRASYLGVVGGGMTVIRRALYDQVPLDRRFVGWGQEDEAWGIALHALGGPRYRGGGPLWHLWHPAAERLTHAVGNDHGRKLRDRYRALSGQPDLLRQLIDGGV